MSSPNVLQVASFASILLLALALPVVAAESTPDSDRTSATLRLYEKCIRNCTEHESKRTSGATQYVITGDSACHRACNDAHPGYQCAYVLSRAAPTKVGRCWKQLTELEDQMLEAAKQGKSKLLAELILRENIEVNVADDRGRTALMIASGSNYSNGIQEIQTIKTLLAMKANPNAADATGWTALMFAKRSEAIEALVEGGANVEAKTDEGMTALMIKADSKNLIAIRALLKAGANPNAKAANGQTALRIAQNLRAQEVIELLKQHGATE